jgi:translation initiation factor 2 beta subunit (eIF-2beta)/eIF-5
LNLDDVENFRKTLKKCPDCGSTEGYWLIAKREKTYFQCKNCAAMLEVAEIFPPSKIKEPEKPRKFLAKLRIVR